MRDILSILKRLITSNFRTSAVLGVCALTGLVFYLALSLNKVKKVTTPASYEYSLKLAGQDIRTFRSPAAIAKLEKITGQANQISEPGKKRKKSSARRKGKSLRKISHDYSPRDLPNMDYRPAIAVARKVSDARPTAPDTSSDSNAAGPAMSCTGCGGPASPTTPTIVQPEKDKTRNVQEEIPMIVGQVKPLKGIVAFHTPDIFIQSAYAANSCTDPHILLLDLDFMTILLENPISDLEITSDIDFEFDPRELQLDLTNPNRYMLQTTGCDINYQRIISSFYEKQDLDQATTLISKVINTPISGVVSAVNPEDMAALYSVIQGRAPGSSTFEDIYELIDQDSSLKNIFQSTFQGGAIGELTNAAPDVNNVVYHTALDEKTAYAYAVDASHWNPAYTIGYEWHVDGAVSATTANWSWTPVANSPSTHEVTMIVGKKNSGDDMVDRSFPYHEVTFDITINDTHPALAPAIALNAASSDPSDTTSVVLDLATGSLVNGVYSDCETFSSFAIVEGTGAPLPSDFTGSCTGGPTQTVSYTIQTPVDGFVTLNLWTMDVEGRVSAVPSNLGLVVDTTAPVITFVSMLNEYIADENMTISWSLTETHSSSTQSFVIEFFDGGSWTSLPSEPLTNGPHSGTLFSADYHLPNINTTSAKIRVTYSDTLGQQTQTEWPFSILQPSLSSSPLSLNMGSVQNKATSAAATLNFVNDGAVNSQTCGPVSIAGANGTEFTLLSDACDGNVISSGGGSCAVTIEATPLQEGTRNATATITCGGDSYSAPVSITSLNNDPTVAATTDKTTNEDTAFTIILGPATDMDGDPLTYSVVAAPAKGAVGSCGAVATDYQCTYTPHSNQNGSDSFTFKSNDGTVDSNVGTVNITITPVNDAPTLVATQTVSTNEDTVLNFNLNAGNDVDGNSLTYIKTSDPASGTLTCSGGTSTACSFTPAADFNGSVTFQYKVNDSTVDSGLATVTINVTGDNDPPVMGADQAIATNEDTAVNFTLNPATDVDLDTLGYKIISVPAKGVISNCIDTTAFGTDRACTYTPNANATGTDTFTYRANDGTADASTVTTVTVTINPVNDAPTLAATQSISTAEDTAKTFDLAAGTDTEGNALTYIKVSDTGNGSITCSGGASRSCTYTPAANWSGTDSFTYKVNDGAADSTVATVNITVTAVNDPPVMAADQTFSVNDDTDLSITLSNASDIDGGALSYKIVSAPGSGTVSNCITTGAYGTDLTCTYHSDVNFNGTDSFTFIANDTFADAATVETVTITVSDTTPAPAPSIARTSAEYTNSTALTFTASSCTDTPMLLVNEGAQPASAALGWQTCTTTASAITGTLGTTQGAHTVKVWSKDVYGNVSTASTNFTIYYDTVLPAMTLTLPPTLQGGSAYSLAWAATESYTTTALNFTVEAYDGSAWSTVGTTASTAGPLSSTAFTKSWAVPSVNTASAKFRVSFVDRAGNTNTVTSGAFTIDSTAPTLTIASPAANSYHLTSATISGTCEAGRDIDFSGAIQTNFSIACSGGTYSQLVNFSDNDGSKTITLAQTDAVGNTTTVSITLYRDEVAPVMTKTAGASPDFTRNNTPNAWSGTCEGNYTISVTGSETTSFACSSGSWSWTPTAKTVDGTYSYDLVQTDAAGNTSSPPLTLSWERDATSPVFSVASPFTANIGDTKNVTNNLSTMTLSGNCEGTNAIVISGSASQTISCSSSSWTWAVPTVSTDATRSYTFTQSDSAGNTSVITLNWTRDTTGPALTIASALMKNNINTVTFSGNCEAGLNIEVTGAQTTSVTCPAGVWSFTSTSFASDATRTFNFKQTFTVSPFNSTTVSGQWIRETDLPVLSNFTTSAADPSRSSFIPVDVSATSQNAEVLLTHFCIKADDSTKPAATDSCFLGINSPAVGQSLGQTLNLNEFSTLLGWTPKTYDMYIWVLDEAGNISNLSSAGAGTLNTDKLTISYDPGVPPTIWDVVAASEENTSIPPTRAEAEVPAGTDVYIRWKVSDNVTLPSGSITLLYTADEITFTQITSGIEPYDNTGCPGLTLASNEGCYKWAGGSPLNTAYKIQVKVTDVGGISTQLISNPLNSGLIKIIAGNTESGLGGSAQTAMFYTHRQSSYADIGTMVVTNDGKFYFADWKRGILTIDQADGKQKIFIKATGTSAGDGGPAVNATLKEATKLALDYQNRLLILDRDRIRRVDLNQSTPTIETIIGGGSDTSDTIANPLDIQIYAHSNSNWPSRGAAFFAAPNGDIYFHSEYAYKNYNISTYRIRIYQAGTGQIISKYFTGTGDAYQPTQDLSLCYLMSPGIAFNPATSQLTGVTLQVMHNPSYPGCDTADRYTRAYFNPGTFVAIPALDDSYRGSTAYQNYTGMDGHSYAHIARNYVMRQNFDGTYTRVLGQGTVGECADGTDATSCMMDIQNLFVTSTGKMYFTDRGMIRTVQDDGTVKTLFGQKLTYGHNVNALNARISEATRVVQLDNGKIIVNDNGGNYLKEFTIEGNINIIAGDGATRSANFTQAANSYSLYNTNWWAANKATGEVFASYYSSGYGTYMKLNRTSGFWESVIGSTTGTHYTSADGMPGADIQGSTSSLNLGLIQGFGNGELIMSRMKYNSTIDMYEDFMLKSYDSADSYKQSHIAGVIGSPGVNAPRAICDATTATSAATCEMPYWDTFGNFQWDSVKGRWITAIVYGGTERNVYEIYPGGNIKQIGYTAGAINNSFVYIAHDGAEYFYYCSGGKIRKYNLTTQTDLGYMTWSMPTLSCVGYSMDYNPTNHTIIFPFEQNGLYGVAEYAIP